jgi:LPS sulfotransferase NodH
VTVVRSGSRRLDTLAPLFILGAPRSGTSLLYKALCLHPDVAYISNWMRRAPRIPALAAVNRLAPRFPRFRRSVWFGTDSANAYVYGERRPLHERLFPMPVEGEPVFRGCGLAPGPATGPPDPAQIACLQKTFAALRRYAGARVVVSKRIASNQRVPLLAAAFPASRFVHLIRDGRAVAFSLSRVAWWEADVVWWLGASPVHWREQGGDPWELRARHWVRELESVDHGLLAVPGDQQLQIRYEDLVEDPLASLGRVAAFAGLPHDAEWITELGRLRYPNRSQRWREGLPSEVLVRIEAIQYEQLRRLGYVA